MKLLFRALAALPLLVGAAQAFPGERDLLNACRAMLDGATAADGAARAVATAHDEAELQKCRQIIKEWTLRDSRMSVDEQGRPLH